MQVAIEDEVDKPAHVAVDTRQALLPGQGEERGRHEGGQHGPRAPAAGEEPGEPGLGEPAQREDDDPRAELDSVATVSASVPSQRAIRPASR